MPTADNRQKPAVIVTRPAHQTAAFVKKLSALDVTPVLFPAIAIRLRSDCLSELESNALQRSKMCIFTSTNAVEGAKACGALNSLKLQKIACIGSTTATALQPYGIVPDYVPPKNGSSEDLLSYLDKSGIPDGMVTIISGDGGRGVLKTALQQQGHEVHYLRVYKRQLPAVRDSIRDHTVSLLPCIISVTSNEGLENLLQLIPPSAHPALFDSPLVVNSDRCASLAVERGFSQHIAIARPPGDQGQIEALEKLLAEIM
jgi:uroporphyrinogen-III synthase